ncbi:MAG TPA: nucleotide pyrophosphohydrolase [Candidatus Angelobacter sp.]|jgi:NTP pyrophosphatase (non-canonical NTP hydrolase)
MNSPLPNDRTVTLSELKEQVGNFAAERGWLQTRTPKNLSMAIAAEAAELMEYFLWEDGDESLKRLGDPERRSAISDEVADVLIYVMEFANVAQIDLTAAVASKIKKNALRFPTGTQTRPRQHD